MSIAELPSSTATGYHPILTDNPDSGFEGRWTAWTARGRAHERAGRQRVIVVAIVAGALALAAVIAYGLLSS